jgi:hypothetical protein
MLQIAVVVLVLVCVAAGIAVCVWPTEDSGSWDGV